MASPPQEHAHPGPRQYVIVAIVLAIITAAEVATFYLDLNIMTLVPILFVMASAKFALVAMFFMHLKFDGKLFTWLFVFGLVLAAALMTAMLVRPISAM